MGIAMPGIQAIPWLVFVAAVAAVAGVAAGRWLERRRPVHGQAQKHVPGRRVPDSLVTVAAFDLPHEAHFARQRLHEHDIPAVVTDENVVGMGWHLATAVGGIKVQVPRSALERAELILEQEARPKLGVTWPEDAATKARSGPGSVDLRCPRCGSTEVYRVPIWRRSVFASILLLGFPLPIWARRYQCDTCSHTWKHSA